MVDFEPRNTSVWRVASSKVQPFAFRSRFSSLAVTLHCVLENENFCKGKNLRVVDRIVSR